jgi:hypothetical protein
VNRFTGVSSFGQGFGVRDGLSLTEKEVE